ncbi:MAG: hypothetical protein HC848_01725 [Limnobacter sp.]|nr:hypothetical protein [Limnobacter sp.]
MRSDDFQNEHEEPLLMFRKVKSRCQSIRQQEKQYITVTSADTPPSKVQPFKRSDWSDVEKPLIKLLTNHTKDMELATWLTEAWLRLYGFKGLQHGFMLAEKWLKRLAQTFTRSRIKTIHCQFTTLLRWLAKQTPYTDQLSSPHCSMKPMSFGYPLGFAANLKMFV